MNATPSPANTNAETLGDVINANGAADRVCEADWVALVLRVATQDQLALRELYDRSHRLVFTLMMRMTHNRQTAEELTLDVFHDLWLRAPQYRADSGTVIAWIMNQSRSRAIDRLRFEQRKKRVNPYPSEPFTENAESNASELSDAEGQRHRLLGAMGALTEGEREAIEQAFFGELTHVEVAARLHEPIGTIKTRIRSGLEKLRQAFIPGVPEP